MEIAIPGDPYRALSPNLRLHYYELHRRKQVWKGRARLAWVAAGRPQLAGRVRLLITLYRGRSVDSDNATGCLKALIDGLKGEGGGPGLFIDDSPRYLELQPVAQVTGKAYSGAGAFVLVAAEAVGKEENHE